MRIFSELWTNILYIFGRLKAEVANILNLWSSMCPSGGDRNILIYSFPV